MPMQPSETRAMSSAAFALWLVVFLLVLLAAMFLVLAG